MSQLALGWADKVVSVSDFNRAEVEHWVPQLKPVVIHHGFEHERFPPGSPQDKRKRQIVTVGAIREDYIRRKGLDLFARASTQFA